MGAGVAAAAAAAVGLGDEGPFAPGEGVEMAVAEFSGRRGELASPTLPPTLPPKLTSPTLPPSDALPTEDAISITSLATPNGTAGRGS